MKTPRERRVLFCRKGMSLNVGRKGGKQGCENRSATESGESGGIRSLEESKGSLVIKGRNPDEARWKQMRRGTRELLSRGGFDGQLGQKLAGR